MSKKRKNKTPELFKVHSHCLRFILEEYHNEVKKDYVIGGKTCKEIEWEYLPNDHRILVRINEYNESELLIPFMIENFPILREHLSLLKTNGEI